MSERKPRFFKRIVKLDSVFNRSDVYGNHQIGSTIKSVKVTRSNSKTFQLEFCPDPGDKDSGSVSLTKGIPQNFATIVNGGCFENFVAQPGVWVEVQFTTEDDQIGGELLLDQVGEVSIKEGEDHVSELVTVNNVGVEVIPAGLTARKVTLHNKGPGSFWIGNNTPAEIQNVNFTDILEEIPENSYWETRNLKAFAGRSDSGNVKVSRRIEF